MIEVVALFLRANLAAAVAILLLLILRRPVRRLFGAEIAYGLWLAATLAAAGAILPARSRQVSAALVGGSSPSGGLDVLHGFLRTDGHLRLLLGLWLAGAALAVVGLAWAQVRFLRREKRGQAGPAVVGVISPRFVVPADYEARFTPEERQIIRAHERTHLERGDAAANALIATAQALCWFNPLVHLAARLAREDQELACDAAVMKRLPVARRRYAETLLKTQLAPTALPLGCYWSPIGRHPLEERVGMLRHRAPGDGRRWAGQAAIVALALGAAGGGWMAKPVRLVAAPAARPAHAPDRTMLFLIYRNAPAPHA